MAIPVVGTYAVLIIADVALGDALPLAVVFLLVNLAAAVAAVGLVLVTGHFLGAPSLAGYGLGINRRWMVDACAGLVIGVAGVAVAFSIGFGAGWFEVVAVLDEGDLGLVTGIALIVLANLCVGLWEELI